MHCSMLLAISFAGNYGFDPHCIVDSVEKNQNKGQNSQKSVHYLFKN